MRATILFAAVFMGLAQAQVAPLGACAATCVDGVFNDPTRLQCAAGDLACVCRAGQNVDFGVTDCINQACGLVGAERDGQVEAAKTNVVQRCVPILAGAISSAPPAATPAVTPPISTPAPAPAPTSTPPPPVVSSQPVVQSSSSVAVPPPPASTPPASAAATTSTPLSPSAAASSHSSSTTASGSATSAASGFKTSSSPSSTQSQLAASATGAASGVTTSSSEGGGLPLAAKIGIGAGVGAVIVLGGLLACCLVLRRRKQKGAHSHGPGTAPPRPARSASPFSLKISNPMPGSGRHYANDAEKGYASVATSPAKSMSRSERSPALFKTHSGRSSDDELDRHARRYEDMSTGAQPRTMI